MQKQIFNVSILFKFSNNNSSTLWETIINIKEMGVIYKFPTDDTNAIRYAAAFYDKNVFNHLTSDSNKEYKPTDGNKISYFVHSFGCITNLQAANNALDWLVVPRELFNSEI